MNRPWRGRLQSKWLVIVVIGLVASPRVEARQEPPKQASTPMVRGEIGKLKLTDKPISVLGGRLEVRMPEGSRLSVRQLDLMGAPESEEHETRVVCDAGKERLVLLVSELFAFAGDDFEGNAKKHVAT